MKSRLNVSTLAEAFNRQHRELDERYSRLLESSKGGDWRDCDKDWEPLSKALRDHMSFEERQLFRLYEKSNTASLADTVALREDHDAIRTSLERLGNEIELHHAPPAELEKFIVTLRQHARREDTLFHPWLMTASLDEATLHRARDWLRNLVELAVA